MEQKKALRSHNIRMIKEKEISHIWLVSNKYPVLTRDLIFVFLLYWFFSALPFSCLIFCALLCAWEADPTDIMTWTSLDLVSGVQEEKAVQFLLCSLPPWAILSSVLPFPEVS